MSIPAQSQADGIVHPTRQQLDELDALIKRMLTLPVDQPGEELASASTVRAPGGYARTVDRGPAELPRAYHESSGMAPAPETSLPEGEEARATMVWSEATGRPERPVHGSLSDVFSAIRLEVASPHQPESPRRLLATALLGPLVWSNAVFDGCTAWVGPAGGWLRCAWGRTVLGYTGLGLLAAAVAWGIVAWTGWTW
ncbi:MAG TPA: hypothetical protein VG013_41315 [Gemmataceae bacterium]|jgi:hypothetical protein|nr:hypothetical protein [Gemmataceae bacterium]